MRMCQCDVGAGRKKDLRHLSERIMSKHPCPWQLESACHKEGEGRRIMAREEQSGAGLQPNLCIHLLPQPQPASSLKNHRDWPKCVTLSENPLLHLLPLPLKLHQLVLTASAPQQCHLLMTRTDSILLASRAMSIKALASRKC